jgi:hypothetical protein
MDVRVVICWYPGNLYQSSVMTVDMTRAWGKVYPSRLACAIDLCQIGLLTIMDQDDMLRSDFDTKDRMLLHLSTVEAKALEEAGFVEMSPAKLN